MSNSRRAGPAAPGAASPDLQAWALSRSAWPNPAVSARRVGQLAFVFVLCAGFATSPSPAGPGPQATAQSSGRAMGPFVQVRPCSLWAADKQVVSEIERAAHDIWRVASRRPADLEVAGWAHHTFETEQAFTDFLFNWANVETGGSFDPEHLNASRGGQELNVGLFQINQTWAIRHNTWGHDSNPRGWSAADAMDPYLSVNWALYHLLGFYRPAGGDLTRMLDGYWHGTFNDRSPYARAVLKGRLVSYGE